MAIPIVEHRRALIANILRRCGLFSGVSDATIDAVASITITKSLAQGSYLFLEDSAVHGFFIVHKGAIKVFRVNLEGKEQVIHVFRPVESLAEEALWSNLGFPADARALETSELLMVKKLEFISLLKQQPELALCVLRSMNQRVCTLVSLLDDLTLKDVKTRLGNWLIEHCPDPHSHEPYSIELPMTKRVLSAELGTLSETFSRTLASFRDQKLLSVTGRTITVLCPVKLAQLLGSGRVPRLVVLLPVLSPLRSFIGTSAASSLSVLQDFGLMIALLDLTVEVMNERSFPAHE